jgi:hypothetical protein
MHFSQGNDSNTFAEMKFTWEEVPMSVTFVRSSLMMPGKFPQAHEYVEKRIKWLKEKFGVEASLMTLLGGQIGRVAMVIEQDSVAQIEKIRREIIGGALPKDLATGPEGLFVPGEGRDRIWLKIR